MGLGRVLVDAGPHAAVDPHLGDPPIRGLRKHVIDRAAGERCRGFGMDIGEGLGYCEGAIDRAQPCCTARWKWRGGDRGVVEICSLGCGDNGGCVSKGGRKTNWFQSRCERYSCGIGPVIPKEAIM